MSVRRAGEFRRNELVDRLSGKKTKEQTNYRSAEAVDTKQMCSECQNYITPKNPESACKKVVGFVKADAVCDLFSARRSPEAPSGPTITITIRS